MLFIYFFISLFAMGFTLEPHGPMLDNVLVRNGNVWFSSAPPQHYFHGFSHISMLSGEANSFIVSSQISARNRHFDDDD